MSCALTNWTGKHVHTTDPQFGDIVDFDQLRQSILHLYDALLPDFDMHKSLQVGTELYGDEPDVMIAAGASMLAWMTIIAAGEDDIAEELKEQPLHPRLDRRRNRLRFAQRHHRSPRRVNGDPDLRRLSISRDASG